MRQIIIARKDLNMSAGKLSAQVAHASLAFLSNEIRDCGNVIGGSLPDYVEVNLILRKDVYEQWFNGIFTKTVCEAKNYNQLMKAKTIAEELGLREGEDFFLIKDACLTDLEPEEVDENGHGYTLTCIGFRPLDDETAWKISKKFQLYR